MPHPSAHFINGKARNLAGWKRDTPDHRDVLYSAPVLPKPIPPSADNSALCSPVENQGELGSCTAHSATSALEYLLKREKRPLVELSRLYLYFFSRKLERTPPTEDSGCQIRNVVKCIAKYGTCREILWPYTVNKFSIQPSTPAQSDALQHRATQYLRCIGLGAIRASIAAGYTLVGGFSVPEGALSEATAKTGLIKVPGPKEPIVGAHAVHFVGYDDKDRLIKFQNSWGKEWGQKGFGFLPYDFIESRLADDFWTIRAQT